MQPMSRLLSIAAGALALTACVHLAAEIATNRFAHPARQDQQAESLSTPSVDTQNAAWCAAHGCPPVEEQPVHVLMDTHAHLSMKPGLGWVFSGVPWDPEHPPHWSYRFSEKMEVDAIRRSGLRLIVVSLYANPMFTFPGSARDATWEEIEQTEELIRRYPDLFALATTSLQARRIIAAGKIALVYHLEAGEWAMRSPEDVAALYRAGVRAVNPVHLYDSWIGASDLQGSERFIINPVGYGNSKIVGDHRENRGGLTEDGKNLLRTLVQYGYIIDISHMSRVAIRDTAGMPELANLPLFNSHMPNLVETGDNERTVDQEAFDILSSRGGLLGLVPTIATPVGKDPFPGKCHGTVEIYARTFALAVERAKGMPIGMASDFNGGIGHLRPTHGPDGCYPAEAAKSEYDLHGLRDAGMLPGLVEAMRAQGADPTPLFAASERFLQMWARVEQAKTR